MMRRTFAALFLTALTSTMMTGQDAAAYLDEYIAKVKPEKRAEFDAINKKMTVLNRRNKGDNWLAAENMYGEGNVVTFISLRNTLADAEKGSDLFMGALAKAGGMAAAGKLFQDFNNTLVSSRVEIRRRRPDLGSNVPTSAAETATLLGKSRFLYMVTVRVRPGRALDYEDQIKAVREARAKAGDKSIWLVSQAVVGQPTGVYFITRPLTSLGDLDGGKALSQLLGDRYKGYQKNIAENTFSTEISILRYLPDLSYPPAEIAAADPAFWNPKPSAPAKKATEAAK
jgi:hypothetical protein